VALVQRMRDVQKRYFKVRSNDDLLLSKKLEREVDLAIREYPTWHRKDLLGGLDERTSE
jgi:hypothetical protein